MLTIPMRTRITTASAGETRESSTAITPLVPTISIAMTAISATPKIRSWV